MSIQAIESFIHQHQLFKRGDSVLIGVSGGADSMYLLYALKQLQANLGIQLHVVHINHQLRKTSTQEQVYIQDICAQWHIPVFIGKMPKLKQKTSLEERARKFRLQTFQKFTQKLPANKIALAHHKDDVAETLLMNLIRGAGLSGLRSIHPNQTLENLNIVRPLLNISKKEILKELKKNRIKYFNDESNKDVQFFRNHIRHKLIPLMEKEYKTNLRDILVNTSKTVADDYDYLLGAAEKAYRQVVSTSRGKLKIHRAKFIKLHKSIQNMLIRLGLEYLSGSLTQFEQKHIDQVRQLIVSGVSNKSLPLPKRLNVYCKVDYAYLEAV